MAIPGFVFAGIILARGGISKYLIDGLRAWVGHLPGGMAVVTVLACAILRLFLALVPLLQQQLVQS